MAALQDKYKKEIMSVIKKRFNIENDMAVPTIEKIIVNAGIGNEYKNNSAVVEEMSAVMAQITGQKAIVVNSKIAISNFKLREGTPNGLKITLRKERMWDFLSKLVNVTLPRIKDFRGVPRKGFDTRGNYTLGIREHTIFPEIDTSKMSKIRSLQVVIVTTAKNDEQGYALLELLGMPFEKQKPQFIAKN
jgi:large subunit ribosomal protein L5